MKEVLDNAIEGIEQFFLMHDADRLHRDWLVQNGREHGLRLVFLEDNPDNTVFIHAVPLITDPRAIQQAAIVLSHYISQRASIEGVSSELDAEWFADQLMDSSLRTTGRAAVFGVTLAAFPGGTVGFVNDDQEPHPGYMRKWMDDLQLRMNEWSSQSEDRGE